MFPQFRPTKILLFGVVLALGFVEVQADPGVPFRIGMEIEVRRRGWDPITRKLRWSRLSDLVEEQIWRGSPALDDEDWVRRVYGSLVSDAPSNASINAMVRRIQEENENPLVHSHFPKAPSVARGLIFEDLLEEGQTIPWKRSYKRKVERYDYELDSHSFEIKFKKEIKVRSLDDFDRAYEDMARTIGRYEETEVLYKTPQKDRLVSIHLHISLDPDFVATLPGKSLKKRLYLLRLLQITRLIDHGDTLPFNEASEYVDVADNIRGKGSVKLYTDNRVEVRRLTDSPRKEVRRWVELLTLPEAEFQKVLRHKLKSWASKHKNLKKLIKLDPRVAGWFIPYATEKGVTLVVDELRKLIKKGKVSWKSERPFSRNSYNRMTKLLTQGKKPTRETLMALAKAKECCWEPSNSAWRFFSKAKELAKPKPKKVVAPEPPSPTPRTESVELERAQPVATSERPPGRIRRLWRRLCERI